jgi:flavin-dependent dehydrogenase
VTALIHDDKRVRVVIDTPSGQREFTASFLVGCDGGRSSVRKLAGFDFPGIDSTVLGRVGRLKLAHRTSFPAPTNNEHGSLQHDGPDDGWVRVRLNERDGNAPGANGGDRESPITVQEMRDAIQRVTGIDVAITEIQEGRRFRNNSRQAATYRKGRVLLAGDAAHVHSPLGGQGLNLGIMDAVNLGWKLAAVLRGFGHDELLDTYTRERHPVGAAVLNNTLAQAALLAPTPQVMALREIMSNLMDIPDVKDYLGRMLSGVGVRYPLPYDAGTDHELLGGHVPDFVVDDTTLYAIMSDGRPVLLHTPPVASIREAAESWQDRVHIVSALVLGRSDLSAALIRPDGVLAWAAVPFASPDITCLKTALHTWIGPPRTGADDDA